MSAITCFSARVQKEHVELCKNKTEKHSAQVMISFTHSGVNLAKRLLH